MNTLAPLTDIKSCGSHWAGEDLSTIDDLIATLKEHPLDRTFENYGNFASSPEWEKADPYAGRYMVCFFGNFLTVSFGFAIYSDDPAIIEKLTTAIRANQQRPDYLSQSTKRESNGIKFQNQTHKKSGVA